MQKRRRRVGRERVPKSDPHGERGVDTDDPKQRAE